MINPNIEAILKQIQGKTLVAATKYVDSDDIRKLFALGIRDIGENRVDALLQKQNELQDLPIRWHFIGHLQTNKVAKIINSIDVLHSLDRLSLAEEIQRRRDLPLDCFVEVNISKETNKTGLDIQEVSSFLDSIRQMDKIHVIGFMGMAENTSDETIIKRQFQTLAELRTSMAKYGDFPNLSMGMSNDYQIAIEEGATHLRLGSILFRKEG